MNPNKKFSDIIHNLQECATCNCKNTMQCRVCAFEGTKLGYKYYEKK